MFKSGDARWCDLHPLNDGRRTDKSWKHFYCCLLSYATWGCYIDAFTPCVYKSPVNLSGGERFFFKIIKKKITKKKIVKSNSTMCAYACIYKIDRSLSSFSPLAHVNVYFFPSCRMLDVYNIARSTDADGRSMIQPNQQTFRVIILSTQTAELSAREF